MSIPERSAPVSINNFVNAINITKVEINSTVTATKYQSETPKWFK